MRVFDVSFQIQLQRRHMITLVTGKVSMLLPVLLEYVGRERDKTADITGVNLKKKAYKKRSKKVNHTKKNVILALDPIFFMKAIVYSVKRFALHCLTLIEQEEVLTGLFLFDFTRLNLMS